LVGEYDQTGALQQEHIWLGDQPVAVANSAQALFHVLSDHLNTPRQIVNTSGVVRWQWDSTDPFGNNAPNPNPTGTAANFTYNLRFPGQYYDGETGLFYNYYRTYDPKTGRYTQSDPIGLKGGLNTFGYVGGNPLRFADPLGLEALMCDGVIQSYRHSWLCAHNICGGLYPDPNNVMWGTGKVRKDPLRRDMCKPIDDQKTCNQVQLENCIAQTNVIGTSNFYSFLLYNCRSWQRDVIKQCKKLWCPAEWEGM
jgi:RHS repeat-associated protein